MDAKADGRGDALVGVTSGDAFSFCESAYVTGVSPWHIRKLTAQGRKLGGGVDTGSLCGRVRPPYGWDLNVEVSGQHLKHACVGCVDLYKQR
jgi:hypothetical protein